MNNGTPMSASRTDVAHPPWANFLRWSTIRPKENPEAPSTRQPVDFHDAVLGSRPYPYPTHKHTPLQDPPGSIRLATILPGWSNKITIRFDEHVLRPRAQDDHVVQSLAEIRKNLPDDWEAFQTVS